MSSLRMIPSIFLALVSASVPGLAGQRFVTYTFDQTLDAVLRIEDRNGDGDSLDPGEVITYLDDTISPSLGVENSQGLLAIGLDDVLATDNFAPDNVVRLRDLNQDGDAFDAGESRIFHGGNLPGGFSLTNPVTISRGPDDAFYVLDNNTLDEFNPEAIYKLKDLNNDGDVDDAGEVSSYFELSPAGDSRTTTFDVEFDNSGNAFVIDITDPNQIESVDIIDPAASGIREWVTSTQLLTLGGVVIPFLTFELTHNPVTDEIIIGTETLQGTVRLTALKDLDGSGTINSAGEIRTLWASGSNADGVVMNSARDLYLANDGSLVFLEASIDEDQVARLVDLNQDGDFLDAGESRIIYDGVTAGAAGQPAASFLLSLTSIAVWDGDANDDGLLNCQDINALTSAIAAGVHDPAFDIDGDGAVDSTDLESWLSLAGERNLGASLSYLFGDMNLNGVVDVSDFNIWNANKFTHNANWCDGDVNADGIIDVSDFNVFIANQFRSSVTAVPEPQAWRIGLLAACLLMAAHGHYFGRRRLAFLCVAREKGLREARQALMPIETNRDSRVPMSEIYAFYQGVDTTEAKVLVAARDTNQSASKLYAHPIL